MLGVSIVQKFLQDYYYYYFFFFVCVCVCPGTGHKPGQDLAHLVFAALNLQLSGELKSLREFHCFGWLMYSI